MLLPSYDHDATNKIAKLRDEPAIKFKNSAVKGKIKHLEKLIHTLQEDFSHCFHHNLREPSEETCSYFEYYKISSFKKLSEKTYRMYKSLQNSEMSYSYDQDYGNQEHFDNLMKKQFTVLCIPYYKIYYHPYLWFYEAQTHMPKIRPEENTLTYEQILSSIPKTLAMIEFDILAAEIFKLDLYVKKKYSENSLLRQEISNILIKIHECKSTFKTSGQFNKACFQDIRQNMSAICQHRGLHNRETHPIFNKIIDAFRLIMRYLTEFYTLPIQPCLPKTRKNMITFFSEPKTYSQKIVEHFLEEADLFMDQANKLNL